MKAGLLAALLAWPLAAFATTAWHAGAVEPTSTRAAAFDATLQKVVGPESLETSTAAYDADLERLRALADAVKAIDSASEVRSVKAQVTDDPHVAVAASGTAATALQRCAWAIAHDQDRAAGA